jgi:hypothetical protein
MKTIPLLFSLLLIATVGCGDVAVGEKDTSNAASATDTAVSDASSSNASIELDEVDSTGLESVLAANSVTLIDFTAVW